SVLAALKHASDPAETSPLDRPGFRLRHVGGCAHVIEHTRLLPRERHHPMPYAVNSRLFDTALVNYVNTCAGSLGISSPVLWFTGPLGLHLTGSFHERLVVYDAVDDWAAHPAFGDMEPVIEEGYREVRSRADLVFAVSPELVNRFEGGHPAVLLAPNGADAERFGSSHPLPVDMQLLPRPIVGYVGALHRRFDTKTLSEVARRMPDVSFALVGRGDDSIASALRPPNIHLLGFRPASEVPAYVSNFDACIIPHVESSLTRSMDPMKVYEFLAAEKPIVASDVSSLQRFDGLLRLAGDAESFCGALHEVLSGAWKPNRIALRRFVEENTWQARVDAMLDAIELRMAG
ncbi:MAG TPA: glycosyltransferase, partial [Coriobacteriia bacterium]|nr:glycosyltransferase [Coriobacteriia bacterium]